MKITDCRLWAKNDWGDVNFGDERLNSRAVLIGADFFRNPFVSPPKMLKSFKKIKAFYRFINSEKVSHEKLISKHTSKTKENMDEQKIILAVQDATTISLDRNYEIEGLYPIGSIPGLVVHNTISVIPFLDHGIVDGLLHQIVVKRKSKNERTKQDNESRLWKESIAAIKVPKDTIVVDVMDRGADAIDIMHCSKKNNHKFIIRATQNRRIKESEEKLFEFADSLTPKGHVLLDVKEKTSAKKRKAKLKISFSKVTLEKIQQKDSEPIECNIVYICEIDTPKKEEPIKWLLLTSLDVNSFEDAQKIAKYYSYRWTIEEYHKCLKTGFRLEQTQLKTLAGIENLLGFISVSSIKLLQLRDIVRKDPNANAKKYVNQEDIDIIKTYYQIKDKEITIDRFLRGIAQLGGFLNRKNDGNPGWQSIWEGWKYFMTLKEGINLYKKGDIYG